MLVQARGRFADEHGCTCEVGVRPPIARSRAQSSALALLAKDMSAKREMRLTRPLLFQPGARERRD